MNRAALLAAIEEATDANVSDYAARNPEEAAADLEYMARECDVRAERLNSLTTLDPRAQEQEQAKQLRNLAAELRRLVEQQEAA